MHLRSQCRVRAAERLAEDDELVAAQPVRMHTCTHMHTPARATALCVRVCVVYVWLKPMDHVAERLSTFMRMYNTCALRLHAMCMRLCMHTCTCMCMYTRVRLCVLAACIHVCARARACACTHVCACASWPHARARPTSRCVCGGGRCPRRPACIYMRMYMYIRVEPMRMWWRSMCPRRHACAVGGRDLGRLI